MINSKEIFCVVQEKEIRESNEVDDDKHYNVVSFADTWRYAISFS